MTTHKENLERVAQSQTGTRSAQAAFCFARIAPLTSMPREAVYFALIVRLAADRPLQDLGISAAVAATQCLVRRKPSSRKAQLRKRKM